MRGQPPEASFFEFGVLRGDASTLMLGRKLDMSIRRKETLVIVERDSVLGIEMREFESNGEKADLIFARSDGTEARVPLDPSKLRVVDGGQIQVDFQYRGGVIKAPEQEV